MTNMMTWMPWKRLANQKVVGFCRVVFFKIFKEKYFGIGLKKDKNKNISVFMRVKNYSKDLQCSLSKYSVMKF